MRATPNIRTVERFFDALAQRDLDAAGTLLDDDVVYRNVGYSRLQGGARVMKLFAAVAHTRMGFEVTVHRAAADGATVLHERTDLMIIGPVHVRIWVYGVFEVIDGRITLWSDHFDAFDMAKAIVRGLVGAVIPSRPETPRPSTRERRRRSRGPAI